MTPGNGLIEGGNTSTLSLNRIDEGYNGYKYRCIVSNSAGSVTSTTVTLSVSGYSKPNTITATPTSLSFVTQFSGYATAPDAQTVTVKKHWNRSRNTYATNVDKVHDWYAIDYQPC